MKNVNNLKIYMKKNPSFKKKNKLHSGEKECNLSESKTCLRVDWMVSQAKGSKVLDIGFTQGIVSLLLAKKGFKVIGADINLISLGFSKNVFKKETIKVKKRFSGFLADFANYKQIKLFDTVIISEVIEHQESPEKIISFAVKHTKENGKIVVTTPLSSFPNDGHKKVFSISDIIDLLPSNFLVSDLKIENGLIYLSAEKKENELSKPLIIRSIFKLTKNSKFIHQKSFHQLLEKQKGIIISLKEEIDSEKQEIRSLQNKRRNLKIEIDIKKEETITSQKEIEDLKTKKKEINALRNSIKSKREEIKASRYKLNHLTEDITNTYEAIMNMVLSSSHTGSRIFNKLFGQCNSIESTPNRLCYILHNSLPYSSGGYATRAKGLADGLTKNGIINPVLITRPGFPFENKSAEIEEVFLEEFIDGVKYRRIKSPIRGKKDKRDNGYLIDSVLRLTEIFIEERAQFIMAASNYYTSFPALIAARRLGLPFFYEVRGFWEINRVSEDPQFKYNDRYQQMVNMETYVAKNADHIFTLTKQMKNELINRGVHEKKITLLPNSCDPSRFYPRQPNQRLANKLNIPSNIPVIGYVGSFVQYEGLEMLVKAAVKLKNKGFEFRLLLVGDERVSANNSPVISEEINRIARNNNIHDFLIMTGRVSHEEVEEYYSLIDITPFPRKSQLVTELVSPMKPLEALAMEKAIVVSSVSALKDIVNDGITGLIFEKDNIDSLVEALSRLIHNFELRKKLGKQGRLWIEKERTWSRTAGIVEKHFKLNNLKNS